MSARGGELVATDESAVGSKSFLDAIVVENGQCDGCFPNPTCTDESDWSEMFGEADDLVDQLLASETGPRRRGRGLSKGARRKYEILDPPVVGITNQILPSVSP